MHQTLKAAVSSLFINLSYLGHDTLSVAFIGLEFQTTLLLLTRHRFIKFYSSHKRYHIISTSVLFPVFISLFFPC